MQGQVADFCALVPGGEWHYSAFAILHYYCKNWKPLAICERCLERVMGIGPTRPAWKAGILPLNYTRTFRKASQMLTQFDFVVNCFLQNNKIVLNKKAARKRAAFLVGAKCNNGIFFSSKPRRNKASN